MSVDRKENWLEDRSTELFEELLFHDSNVYHYLSLAEIDKLCYEQAEKDYMDQPEVDI